MAADPNRLRVFTEVARRGSNAAAAAALHLTPSAVSHALRRLEAEVGRELVRHESRRARLTEAGLRLYEVCERAFSAIGEVEARLAAGTLAEPLVLGCTVEFGTQVLVPKLAPFVRENADLCLHFFFSNELAAPLASGEVDLVVDCRVHLDPRLEVIELFRERYVVVAAPGFLQERPVPDPAALGPVPVLSLDRGGAWWDRLMEALPPARRPVFSRVQELTHLRGMIGAACEGLGAALVPRYSVTRELAAGCLVALFPGLPLAEDRFCVYQKKAWAGRDRNRRLVDALKRLSMEEYADGIAPVKVAGKGARGKRPRGR